MLSFLLLSCALPEVDTTADAYDTRRPGPDLMVQEDGNYLGGWWDSFDGTINPEDSQGPEGQLQGWIHWSIDTERYLVVANLVDVNKASNTALLVVDKQEQTYLNSSLQYRFGDNVIEHDTAFTEASQPPDGSWATVTDAGIEFEVHSGDLSLTGSAAAQGDSFVQTTRGPDGYGWLQWYTNLSLTQGTLTIDGVETELPAGSLGVYDRMVGHRIHVQSWNWLSMSGTATDESTGETAVISVQVAKDQEAAQPAIAALKYTVWVDGVLTKLPSANFDYSYSDEDAKETGDWAITSDDTTGDWIEVEFHPEFHRRDQSDWLWFLHTDFNQHYGTANGKLHVDGRTWLIDDMYALCEDSLIQL
jgi:Protein of unknown function (DUF2804)